LLPKSGEIDYERVVYNPAECHLSLATVLKSGDVAVCQIWVGGLTLPWLVVAFSDESGSFSVP